MEQLFSKMHGVLAVLKNKNCKSIEDKFRPGTKINKTKSYKVQDTERFQQDPT